MTVHIRVCISVFYYSNLFPVTNKDFDQRLIIFWLYLLDIWMDVFISDYVTVTEKRHNERQNDRKRPVNSRRVRNRSAN